MRRNTMNQMTWQDYAAKAGESILFIPVGSTEQHSTHLPLGTDTMIPEYIIGEISKHIDCVVAPSVNYGYKSLPTSGGGPLFPGTVDLSGSTMISLVRDLLGEFIRDGWQKIVLFSGHVENEAFIMEAADLLTRDQKAAFPRIVVTNWWSHLDDATLNAVFDEIDFPGWDLEHAAVVETSWMMHIAPELVRVERMVEDGLERVPPFQQFPPSPDLIPATGSLHTPRGSSAAKGKMMCDNVIANFLSVLPTMFGL